MADIASRPIMIANQTTYSEWLGYFKPICNTLLEEDCRSNENQTGSGNGSYNGSKHQRFFTAFFIGETEIGSFHSIGQKDYQKGNISVHFGDNSILIGGIERGMQRN